MPFTSMRVMRKSGLISMSEAEAIKPNFGLCQKLIWLEMKAFAKLMSIES